MKFLKLKRRSVDERWKGCGDLFISVTLCIVGLALRAFSVL